MNLSCPFCDIIKRGSKYQPIIFETESVASFISFYPVSKYHALIIPKRHVRTPFELTKKEWNEIFICQNIMKKLIEKVCNPDGYNLGFNVGKAGGQNMNHLHYHMIPRFIGDVPDPEGGIRNVIPNLGPYHRLKLPQEEEKVKRWSRELLDVKKKLRLE